MLTFNGGTVLRASLREPRVGLWTADVVLEQATELEVGAPARFVADGETWVGQVLRGAPISGLGYARIVAGAVPAPYLRARPYERATVRLIATEIATAAGLTLSSTIASSLLSTEIAKWSRCSGAPLEALAALVSRLGVAWRVLRDGTLWFGTETWDAIEVEARIARSFPATLRLDVAPDAPTLRPGTTWSGRQIVGVIHRWDGATYRAAVTHV